MGREDLDHNPRDDVALLGARDPRPPASVVVDGNGAVIELSDAARALLGDRAVGVTLAEAVSALDRNELALRLRAALLTDGAAETFELPLKHRGRFEPFEIRCERLPGGKRAVFFTNVAEASKQAVALLADVVTLFLTTRDRGLDERLRSAAQLVTQVRADLCIIDVEELGALHRAALATTAACDEFAPAFLFPPSLDDDADSDTGANGGGGHEHGSPIVAAVKRGQLTQLRGPEAHVIAGCARADGDAHHAFAPTSLLVLPLALDGDRNAGALTIATLTRPRLSDRDREMFAVLAHIIGGTVERSRAQRFTDTTQRRQRLLLKKAEVELRAAVASVSLAAHAALAQSPPDDQRRSKRHLEAIHRAATRMAATITHMSETLHATPPPAEITVERHVAKLLVHTAVERCAPFALEKKTPLVVECMPDLAAACDPDRAQAALCAVLRHELRRAHPNQPVRVVVERSGKKALRFCFSRSSDDSAAAADAAVDPHEHVDDIDESLELLTARTLASLQGGALDVGDDGTISLWLPSADP